MDDTLTLFEWKGEGGWHLFETWRLLTFSAFRMGAYSRLGAYSFKYGTYIHPKVSNDAGFRHRQPRLVTYAT